ncbi:integrase [Burkholderia cepacia]|uniref:tyrosine-type recombinase/integrase n=1 Tax=Burkholderia cepacia TaxID=292 RepID=UPI000F5A3C72|nr:tyrosine-type recombinase/integrase [Burkholderia cepacia]RQT56341.1 integrase [Burkholderia cepacia]
MSNEGYRVVHLRSFSDRSWEQLCWDADIHGAPDIERRYRHLPLLVAIVDSNWMPVWAPTMFLARCSMVGRGITGDTSRTYGESLVSWLGYISQCGLTLETVDEETLQMYRANLAHAKSDGRHRTSTATANLRVTVAVRFHLWCQNSGFPSPLGTYLLARDKSDRALAPRVVSRHPRLLSTEELSRIFQLARQPYKSAFQWGLTTGLRRFEAAGLLCSSLPPPEQISLSDDGLVKLTIRRKGGKDLPVYAPTSLVEQTHWYVLTERPTPQPGYEDFVFLGRNGRPPSPRKFSEEFRRCADLVGSDATLHHLRHTYAVNVLRFLELANDRNSGEARNCLKTLQVLMGHSNSEATEIYLVAMNVTSDAVVSALDYLYGITCHA